MRAIDTRGSFDCFMSKEELKIDKDNLKNICLIEVGAKTCRYIMSTGLNCSSFICAKHTPMKKMLDELVEKGQMTAIGDNCVGLKPQIEDIGEPDAKKQTVPIEQNKQE